MAVDRALSDIAPVEVHHDQAQLFVPPEPISSRDLCVLAGISYRQLDYWCRTDLLKPAVPANGSGSARRFDEAEVAVARAVKVLLPFWTDRHEAHYARTRSGPKRDGELLALLDRVRKGDRTMVEVERGIWFDLEVLCE